MMYIRRIKASEQHFTILENVSFLKNVFWKNGCVIVQSESSSSKYSSSHFDVLTTTNSKKNTSSNFQRHIK